MHSAMVSAFDPGWLSGLNPPQREAVETLDGPVLVLAGAGTGKTRVLTSRLAQLLMTGRAREQEILAVTFTNKAAGEMRERVSALLGGRPVEGWWLGTFHALAARMLRRDAERAGLTPQFTILDEDDQLRLLKGLMEAEGVDFKKWPPKTLLAKIGRWKDRGLAPEQVPPGEAGEEAGGKMLRLYVQYQARLRSLNACDFGDLLLHMIRMFQDPAHAEVLAAYHRRFRYILVDEYQDTNVAQYLWLRLLARGSGNICCVGDDDQSIYGWRGAEVGNILRFEKDFPGAKLVRLEQNYRSTGHILGAAGGLIARNAGRLGKTLWSDGGDGEKVSVRGFWDAAAEARFVGEEIDRLRVMGVRLSQVAILVRAGFQTREFEERFIQTGLPYRVIGGPRFYERQEIRDALAYLRVVAQPADDLALERIVNVPKRGLGDATLSLLHNHARARGIPLLAAMEELCATDDLKPKVRATLQSLVGDLARWRDLLRDTAHDSVAAQILDESGYMAMWKADKTPDAPGRIENLKELVSGMAGFESLSGFLEHVSLVMETQGQTDGEQVTLMTLHAAKGLEFDVVFLPGWEEGLFPSQRTMDENGIKGLEEERRLAYVGLTRARKRATVSYASNRRVFGNWMNALPSRFIEELPEEHVSVHSDVGLYEPGRSSHWDSSGFSPSAARVREAPRRVERSAFAVGARVWHERFGSGTVVNVDGHKLDIAFDQAGFKRVMDSFVEAAD